MMSPKTWGFIIAACIAAIAFFLGFYVATRVPESAPAALPAASSSASAVQSPAARPATSSDAGEQPLSALVAVEVPRPGAHVGHSFIIKGMVPGSWSFEAQFPIQVRDASDNIVGRATGRVAGDWQTDQPVAFSASMQVDATFKGSAVLVLMKDNPSGLPENDDAVTVPIVIQ